MSNVKLIIGFDDQLVDQLRDRIGHLVVFHHIDDIPPYNRICQYITQNYDKLLILITSNRSKQLPVSRDVFKTKQQLYTKSIDQIIGFILDNYSVRVTHRWGKLVDIYLMFIYTRNVESISVDINLLLDVNYKTRDTDKIIVWGKPLTDISADDRKRIGTADLSFPLLVDPEYILYDGHHRLMKALKLGQQTVNIKIVSDSIAKKCEINYKTEQEYGKHFTRPITLM